MAIEIGEQPDVLRRQLAARAEVAAVARELRRRGCETVRFGAHGSSDNAATYGVYALGLLAGVSAMRDSLSLHVHHRAALPLGNAAVVGISQSGQTPDVVEYVRAAREAGGDGRRYQCPELAARGRGRLCPRPARRARGRDRGDEDVHRDPRRAGAARRSAQ